VPITEVTIDWFKSGERQDSEGFVKQQVLLIAIPNEIISKYKNIFKMAGLNLHALEMESISLIRALSDEDVSPTLIVDIGSRSTNIAIAENGALRYNYQTDFSGVSLTQAISSGLGINIKRAEELKKQKGLLGQGGEYELSTLTLPFLDAIINEARRALNGYEKIHDLKISRIILSGGGAKLLGIKEYFGKEMNLPVKIGNPFSKVEYPAAVEPIIKELGPMFSVAIGLGIRKFV